MTQSERKNAAKIFYFKSLFVTRLSSQWSKLCSSVMSADRGGYVYIYTRGETNKHTHTQTQIVASRIVKF